MHTVHQWHIRKDIDFFDFDLIAVPINIPAKNHWILGVIQNPKALLSTQKIDMPPMGELISKFTVQKQKAPPLMMADFPPKVLDLFRFLYGQNSSNQNPVEPTQHHDKGKIDPNKYLY